jgi:3-oxoacyl-[acyl-carrier protein] reductase
MDIKNPEYVPGHGLLKGKSVLVTAAAGVGIGFAAAKKSVEEGCRAIVISDIHEGRLQASVEKLKEETGLQQVWGKVCNVANEEEVRALVDFAEQQLGGIDILINNAGLGTSKLLVEMEDPEWFKVIDVTLNGTMRMTRYMMQVMKARGQGGVIVNNASVLGWRAQKSRRITQRPRRV